MIWIGSLYDASAANTAKLAVYAATGDSRCPLIHPSDTVLEMCGTGYHRSRPADASPVAATVTTRGYQAGTQEFARGSRTSSPSRRILPNLHYARTRSTSQGNVIHLLPEPGDAQGERRAVRPGGTIVAHLRDS